MKTQMNSMLREFLTVGLAAWLCCAVSCSSIDQAPPAGGRVEHPDPTPAPTPMTTTDVPTTDVVPSSAPAPETPAPPAVEEQRPKALAEDAPSRPWSRNVPKRSCKKDDVCGDGFCDRGRCAAIWTYTGQYGQPCEENLVGLLCIDGRFRSCVSDAECAWTHFAPGPKCVSNTFVPGGRVCAYTIPSIAPSLP
jgi:hypothetical protein